ncbi:MAG: hypothetical protein AUH43_02965 [Acidobacteria bacterium 13_1_40CM_65_14]|nr:MAG: hypothetical protein AUH43_02965 [Acidobacteria bacterium 13_1_40CM_65_14]
MGDAHHEVQCAVYANAYAERFVRTIKESCLDRMILVGEGSLRRAVGEFIEHYHRERNHQGLGNQLIVLQSRPPAHQPGARHSRSAARSPLIFQRPSDS